MAWVILARAQGLNEGIQRAVPLRPRRTGAGSVGVPGEGPLKESR